MAEIIWILKNIKQILTPSLSSRHPIIPSSHDWNLCTCLRFGVRRDLASGFEIFREWAPQTNGVSYVFPKKISITWVIPGVLEQTNKTYLQVHPVCILTCNTILRSSFHRRSNHALRMVNRPHLWLRRLCLASFAAHCFGDVSSGGRQFLISQTAQTWYRQHYRYMKYAQMQTDAVSHLETFAKNMRLYISMRQPRFHLSTANRLPSRTVSDLCFRTRLERLLYAFWKPWHCKAFRQPHAGKPLAQSQKIEALQACSGISAANHSKFRYFQQKLAKQQAFFWPSKTNFMANWLYTSQARIWPAGHIFTPRTHLRTNMHFGVVWRALDMHDMSNHIKNVGVWRLWCRKLLFPISLQLKRHASPSRKLALRQVDQNYTIRVIYVYICIGCQPPILSHMVPELINNLICWNCKGCIGKSIRPVQYKFTIPSLLAQCHVAGPMPRYALSAS